MRILDVWLEAAPFPIGHLYEDGAGNLSFAYTPEWLADPHRHLLSLALPFSEEAFGDVATRAYFDNLLQENDQLEQMMRREGIARGDLIGLFTHLGADLAGSVSILPHGADPIKRPGDLDSDYDALSNKDLEDLVDRMTKGRLLPAALRDPSPVAGVRRKFTLVKLPDGSFAIPKDGSGAPTTHILKMPDPLHRHEERDEAFVTDLAERCGLLVGKNEAVRVAGRPCLLIERFDRVLSANKIYRIHQEDFAQAAGLPSSFKYERNGQGARRFDAGVIGRILEATAEPIYARSTFLRATLFNLLIGNNDNHAKNHALLHLPGRAPDMARLYDLVPVLTAPGFTDELAFKIGNARRAEDITIEDLTIFAETIGFTPRAATNVVRETATILVELMEIFSADFPVEMNALDNQTGKVATQLSALLDIDIPIRSRSTLII